MLASGRYRLVERLGRGAMGEVWRAEDTSLEREVAVKLLLEQTAAADVAERFRREAQTAARLNSPHVVAVYDFDEEDEHVYLVLELVAGRSLREELAARGPLPIDEACGLASQAATGLAAAHEQGVIHRDVKPGNLLLAADGVVKVADFGIARAVMETASSLTTTGAVLGTTAYLAPERGTGRPAEPASDVYALGCVMYEMLCGHPPFSGDPAAVVYQHVNTTPCPPADIRPEASDALADFIRRMLAKDPAQRPTAAQVADFLAESPSVADTRGSSSPTAEARTSQFPPILGGIPGKPRFRRRPAIPAALALVAVFLTACVVGYQLNSGTGEEDAHPTSPTGPATPAPSRSPVQEDSSNSDDGSHSAGDEHGPEEAQHPDEEAQKKAQEERKRQEEAAKKAVEEERKEKEEESKRLEEAGKKEAEEEKKR